MTREPAVRVRVDTLRITAASAVEAHRLAEALPAAIERAWQRRPGDAAGRARQTPADVAAERVVALARAELAARRLTGPTP